MPYLRFAWPPLLLLSWLLADLATPAPKLAPAPPPQPEIRTCTLIGCSSGVTLLAHLNASPAELVANGAFTACLAEHCWDGKVVRNAPDRSQDIFLCETQKSEPFPQFCAAGALPAERSGAT